MEGRQGAAAGIGRGAAGRVADPLVLTHQEHLAPWLDRKDNSGLGFPSASSLIQEAKKVKPQEEVTVFELKAVHISPNSKITKLNQLIVTKLGALSIQRMEYLRALAAGASVGEENILIRNIRNLFGQVYKFQQAVSDLGGVFYPTPSVFNDIKDL